MANFRLIDLAEHIGGTLRGNAIWLFKVLLL